GPRRRRRGGRWRRSAGIGPDRARRRRAAAAVPGRTHRGPCRGETAAGRAVRQWSMSLALAKPVASGPASLVPFAPASQRRLIRGAVALQCADETLVRKAAGLHRRLAAAAPSVRGADRADD